ncbi:hypothetical protein K7X08_035382 [Anisodus acutangulus]|uniref:Thaumatin-like protein n=1 Tax=Anisodus acutangulus TaxID=402998 RepID=A0A9Q1LKL9_9SOLA|nr:hypothetical protein K7X08_035382 [Anisodus acutangulus]
MGFQLNAGQSASIPSAPGWSGRLWARTGCTFDASGAGSCQTGDWCIVDGYNLPMVATPQGVNGGCNATGCVSNLNMGCPKELQVVGGGQGNVVACKSACEAFGLDQYCCAGEFANPTTCRPSFYSSIFKRACPRAYSYAYDDGTSTFTCKASDYAIIFCPMKGVQRPKDGETTSPIDESKMEKFPGMASSSNILLPFPMLIALLFQFMSL